MVTTKTNRPIQKVLYGGLGGAITTILVFFIRLIANVEIPAEVSAAITTVVVFFTSYLTPLGANEVDIVR